MSGAAGPAACAERASASADGQPLFRGVSLEVARGSTVALLGDRTAAAALLRGFAGTLRVSEGRLEVLGLDPARRWRLRTRRLHVPAGARFPTSAARSAEILLLEEPAALGEAGRAWLRERISAGMAAVMATTDAGLAREISGRAAFLSRGRLIAEGPIEELVGRFRRIRFVSRLTETRSAFGTELDEFESVRVRVRGWGIEAVVSNFDEPLLERLRGVDGVFEVAAEPMTLAEIAEACGAGA